MSKDAKNPRKPNRTRRITPDKDGTVNLGLGERKFVGDPDPEVNARLDQALRDDWDRAWRAKEFPPPNETDAEWLDRVEKELLPMVQEHLCPVPPDTSEATVFLEYTGSVLALDLGNGPTLYHLPEAYPEDARGADGMADAVMLAEHAARQTAFQGLLAIGVLRKDGSLPQVAAKLGACQARLWIEKHRWEALDGVAALRRREAGGRKTALATAAEKDLIRTGIDKLVKDGLSRVRAAKEIGRQLRHTEFASIDRMIDYDDKYLANGLK